jgi:prophage regulatory protein
MSGDVDKANKPSEQERNCTFGAYRLLSEGFFSGVFHGKNAMSQSIQLTDSFLRISNILGDNRRNILPIIPISKSSWWAGVKSGKYPQPVKLGPRTTAWRASDIQKVIDRFSSEGEDS